LLTREPRVFLVQDGTSARPCQLSQQCENSSISKVCSGFEGSSRLPSVPPSRHWRGLVITHTTCIPAAGFNFSRNSADRWTVQYRYPEGPGRWGLHEEEVRHPQQVRAARQFVPFRGQHGIQHSGIWIVIIDDEHLSGLYISHLRLIPCSLENFCTASLDFP